MNVTSPSIGYERLRLWVSLGTRLFDATTSTVAFNAQDEAAIQRIYVINLDRQPDRWEQTRRELSRLRNQHGPLMSITRRFSAVDARYIQTGPDYSNVLQDHYSLADQVAVEPIPGIAPDDAFHTRRIDMSPQEIAVALSHIGVWMQIVDSGLPYSLVLEDDVYFRRGFMRRIDGAWAHLMNQEISETYPDILYLSFKDVGPEVTVTAAPVRRPRTGLWQLSGYVLSQRGARRLIELLPSRGPIDLWVNLQFGRLDVFATKRPIIEQRADLPSSNSYSVLPVLSQIGVLTREKPLLAPRNQLPTPVFAVGESGGGLSSMAIALSMLGYRCCHDLDRLPRREAAALFDRKPRVFDAYVNVGSLGTGELRRLADLYPNARFIAASRTSNARCRREVGELREWTAESDQSATSERNRARLLVLPVHHPDKWELLSKFLGSEYPASPYPIRSEIGQRRLLESRNSATTRARRLRFDKSPWIVPSEAWDGIPVAGPEGPDQALGRSRRWLGADLVGDDWVLRDDTFPSNLAVFRPNNLIVQNGHALLELRREQTMVRGYTSAAIAKRGSYRYGRFEVVMRPSNVRGLITGVFLHRNRPRQEIDLEFLGRDTRRLLLNVYHNPGDEGAKLEYGYRGTPVLVELGFDAADDFHLYAIEWTSRFIRWRVDGRLVHERLIWNPTPIPDLPLEFNVNLWHSRSKGLAGSLDSGRLPARAEIEWVRITEDR